MWRRACLTVVSLSWSQREPMMKATSRPSSNQPMDSSGHSVRKWRTSSRCRGHSPDTEINAERDTGTVIVPCALTDWHNFYARSLRNSGGRVYIKHEEQRGPSLTFSLDFKHAYGILRVERADFACGERVSPLDARRNWRWWLHWFDERLRAHYGHGTILHSSLQPRLPRLALSRSAGSLLSGPARRKRWFASVFMVLFSRLWFTSWFAFEYLLLVNEWTS